MDGNNDFCDVSMVFVMKNNSLKTFSTIQMHKKLLYLIKNAVLF